VQLSNLYDNAWRLNDGSYVLSNNVNFEPYRDLASKDNGAGDALTRSAATACGSAA
jgi:hypothetical protein